ncbi:hypothetical protein H8D36_02300 [archaeon]|nr:hypothetical protein [archaeon]MBL7057272.1 hypothetical protein [Candidatus Woesearchaeota archaeon]
MKTQNISTKIEKKTRKSIRVNRKIKKEKIIELLDDGSKEFRVAKLILKNIFGKNKKIRTVKKISKQTLIPTNLDREIKEKLNCYLNNKTHKYEGIKILENILEDEIIGFCKTNKIKIGTKEKRNDLIEAVEKLQPRTKYALAKSLEKIFP